MSVHQAIKMTSPFVECVILDVKTYQDSNGFPKDEEMLTELLIHVVHETGCSNCLVWAKSDRVVQLVKQLSPGQRTGYIVMNETEAVRKEGMHVPLRIQDSEVVGMHHAMVDGFHLDLLHKAGQQLYSWTINDIGLMRRMLDIGVDAIVTNQPKAVTQAIERRLDQCAQQQLESDL